jgi:N-acetylmuramoyl-L-alanine amidase
MRRLSHGLATLTAAAAMTAFLSPTAVHAAQSRKQTPVAPSPSAVSAAADAAAATAPVSASPHVLFGGAPIPVPSPALAPFRDASDGELCVAPESLAPMGITYVVDDQTGQVTLAAPDGVKTVTVPAHRVAGKPGVFVPVVQVVEALGGKCEWHAASNTLYARALLTSAEIIGGQLRLRATLPIMPTVRVDRGGRLVVVDVTGAEVGTLAKGLNLAAPQVKTARVGQFTDDVARLVLEMKEPGAFAVLGDKPGLQVVLNPADPSKLPTVSLSTPKTAVASAGNTSAPRSASKPAAPVARKTAALSIVNGVSFRRLSDDKAQFVVSADRAPQVRAALSRGRFTLDLLNATLAAKAAALELGKWDHPFLKAAQLVANGDTAARLVLDLTRAVCYTVRPTDRGNYLIELTLPKSASGRLAGKLVVVDPGHGGSDSGAKGVNGNYEKHVNLAIGTQLAQQLQEAGANVIMTRSGDSTLPVNARPQIANQAGADFFISVHADSADRNHSVNGSTVYFHMDWASCRALAQCIADRFADMGGIRTKGVHSDGRQWGGRFVNGYGVLRGSQMVAVLVECGYMTNSNDVRRLSDPASQKKIAGAIMAGLRDYVEGNPDLDTRFINPQPEGALGGEVPPEPMPAPDADAPTADDASLSPSASASAAVAAGSR